jgi:hypothetical protein
MSIGKDLLHAFELVALRRALPRVSALHLPFEKIRVQKQSAFCALELEDGSIGLAYVGLGNTRGRLAALKSLSRNGDTPRQKNGRECRNLLTACFHSTAPKNARRL